MYVEKAMSSLAKYRGNDEQWFAESIGWLLDALLQEYGCKGWSGKFRATIDGVEFSIEKPSESFCEVYGIAYVLEPQQLDPIQPFFAKLHFDPLSSDLSGAVLLFGRSNSTEPPIEFRGAKKLSQSVRAKATSTRPKIQFDWKYIFKLADGEWSMTESGTT